MVSLIKVCSGPDSTSNWLSNATIVALALFHGPFRAVDFLSRLHLLTEPVLQDQNVEETALQNSKVNRARKASALSTAFELPNRSFLPGQVSRHDQIRHRAANGLLDTVPWRSKLIFARCHG